jgi:hemerythrin superfamily protein
MHAIELLLDDHEHVAGLFDRVRAGADGVSLFRQIRHAINIHRQIEERFFYPKLIDEGDEELRDIVELAIEDHRQVEADLEELKEMTEDTRRFEPRLKVMMEDVERHAEEEEERMFPLVEDQFDEGSLERLGTTMEAEKSRLWPTGH